MYKFNYIFIGMLMGMLIGVSAILIDEYKEKSKETPIRVNIEQNRGGCLHVNGVTILPYAFDTTKVYMGQRDIKYYKFDIRKKSKGVLELTPEAKRLISTITNTFRK